MDAFDCCTKLTFKIMAIEAHIFHGRQPAGGVGRAFQTPQQHTGENWGMLN